MQTIANFVYRIVMSNAGAKTQIRFVVSNTKQINENSISECSLESLQISPSGTLDIHLNVVATEAI